MTINEAISRAEELKPSTYPHNMLVNWLGMLDDAASDFMALYHKNDGETETEYQGYNDETDPETVLLIPHPYDEIYIYWLFSKIDFFNEEYEKFNNSNAMYESVWSDFQRYYNRDHTRKSYNNRYW